MYLQFLNVVIHWIYIIYELSTKLYLHEIHVHHEVKFYKNLSIDTDPQI